MSRKNNNKPEDSEVESPGFLYPERMPGGMVGTVLNYNGFLAVTKSLLCIIRRIAEPFVVI